MAKKTDPGNQPNATPIPQPTEPLPPKKEPKKVAARPKNKKTKPKTGRGVGRPRAVVDWKLVDQMLMAHVKADDIIGALGILSRDTLYAACLRDNKMDFSTYSQQKRSKGISNARMTFYKEAFLDKDHEPKSKATKEIFWLKNHGDMADKVDKKVEHSGGVTVLEFPDNKTNPGTTPTIPMPWDEESIPVVASPPPKDFDPNVAQPPPQQQNQIEAKQ